MRRGMVAIVATVAIALPMPSNAGETARGISVPVCGSPGLLTRIPLNPAAPVPNDSHQCCAMACHLTDRRKRAAADPTGPDDDAP